MMVVVAFAPAAVASGKKETKATVSFHIETEATDNPKMIFPQQMPNGETRFFRRMPELTTKDIQSFSPFPSGTGDDYGLAFKLKGNAATRLAAITNANQGRWIIAQINGRVADGVTIDKQIDDGVIVIWKNVSLADISLLDEDLPRAGEEGKKKKK